MCFLPYLPPLKDGSKGELLFSVIKSGYSHTFQDISAKCICGLNEFQFLSAVKMISVVLLASCALLTSLVIASNCRDWSITGGIWLKKVSLFSLLLPALCLSVAFGPSIYAWMSLTDIVWHPESLKYANNILQNQAMYRNRSTCPPSRFILSHLMTKRNIFGLGPCRLSFRVWLRDGLPRPDAGKPLVLRRKTLTEA